MRDIGTASVKEHKVLISRAETKIAEHAAGAAEAGERAQAAKDRLERIRRGESVPGGLGNAPSLSVDRDDGCEGALPSLAEPIWVSASSLARRWGLNQLGDRVDEKARPP